MRKKALGGETRALKRTGADEERCSSEGTHAFLRLPRLSNKEQAMFTHMGNALRGVYAPTKMDLSAMMEPTPSISEPAIRRVRRTVLM